MDTRFRLEQVIRTYDPAKLERRGLFADMVNWSKGRSVPPEDRVILERHRLSGLFHNKESSVSFDVLNCICEYLVSKCKVPEHVLPQELFGAKDHQLLDLIGATSQLQFFLGMRSSSEWGPNAYIMAADAALQSRLTNKISQHLARRAELLEGIDTILIDAPPRDVKATTKTKNWKRIQESAATRYRQFLKSSNLTMVATGSPKVNCMVEQVLAQVFGVNAHTMVRKSVVASERQVPVFVRYRDSDPQPSSCFGGLHVASDVRQQDPGIYFECDDGSWDCLPCDDKQRDVALVTYTHHTSQRRTCLVCCGFSSLATRFLTEVLSDVVDEIWPPQFETRSTMVGMFLVEFHMDRQTAKSREAAAFPKLREFKVIPIGDRVIQRRLGTPGAKPATAGE